MTISLAAVFIPILFMSGILGRLFREFAVTITAAILISGMVSVTLTPMLCSRFLRAATLHAKGGSRPSWSGVHGFFPRTNGASASSCGTAPAMLVAFFAVLAATAAMFGIVPKGFIPDQDNDSLNLNVRAAQGTSYYEMVRYLQSIAADREREPVRREFFPSTGGGFGSMNTARLNLQLTPRRTRRVSAAQIARRSGRSCCGFPASARS